MPWRPVEPVDFLVPGVRALRDGRGDGLARHATGFERRYGVLQETGFDTVVTRRAARGEDGDGLALEVIQFVLVIATGVALGWELRSGVVTALALLLVGTVAFAGIGMLMAGTLRRGEPRHRTRCS